MMKILTFIFLPFCLIGNPNTELTIFDIYYYAKVEKYKYESLLRYKFPDHLLIIFDAKKVAFDEIMTFIDSRKPSSD